MPRHRRETPTEVEMEILQVLWEHEPATVREVVDVLNQTRPRAYTSILGMLNVMHQKGLVVREMKGRAHLYRTSQSREKTLGGGRQGSVGQGISRFDNLADHSGLGTIEAISSGADRDSTGDCGLAEEGEER